MKKRHTFFYTLIRPLAVLFVRFKFGYRYEIARDLPDNYIVLSNHTTDYDVIFVAASFRRMMYVVGSEHISRWPRAYKFLKYAFAPILRPKGTTASSTVKDMLRTLRAGNNVLLFAEGVRSWDGVSCPVLPSTGKMIKTARCGLVTYRIEGGYFASPMWSASNTRRGRLKGAPVGVYTAEQLAAMSVEEVNHLIARDLYEDAYARQKESPARYKGKNLAEKLENLLFICPECGRMDSFRSHGDTVECACCGLNFRYTEYGMLEGGPFDNLKDFAAWQRERVAEAAERSETYTALGGKLIQVQKHSETPVAEGPVSMDEETFSCGDKRFAMTDVLDLAMHGKRTLVFSTPEGYFELVPSEEANVLKFHLLYQEYQKKAAACPSAAI